MLQTKYIAIEEFIGMSRQSVPNFFHRLRYVAFKDYKKDLEDHLLDDPGVIVEIDESLVVKVKYHRGKDIFRKQVWFFGLRERHSCRCYFEIVANRDRDSIKHNI